MKQRNFKFSEETDERITQLASELKTTQTDVIRIGLRLVNLAVRETRRGNRLALIIDGSPVALIGEWSDVQVVQT